MHNALFSCQEFVFQYDRGFFKEVTMKTYVLATLFSLSLFAQNLVITVECTNGASVPGIPVDITDESGSLLFAGTTDGNGQFTMLTHAAPIYMWFTAKNGATCGAYDVQLNDPTTPTTGTVTLQYYPIILPCSCARYSQ